MQEGAFFHATEYSARIVECKGRLIQLYLDNGYDAEARDVTALLEKVDSKAKIRVVFAGQYTAGKSTIISALSGDKTISIDSDVSTDVAADYSWNGSVILTDTPGLFADHKEHEARSIEAIREADILVYCITSDLFTPETKADFIQWAFNQGYAGKMFLVINKMSAEAGEYSQLVASYSKSIDRTITPHSLAEVKHCFVDAKDYRLGIDEKNNELIDYSHFEQLITLLNQFVIQKGQLVKMDTPIQILKSSIDRISATAVDDEQDRAYYSLLDRIEKRVDQRRSQTSVEVHECIASRLRIIINKGYELSGKIGIEDIDFTEQDLEELVSSTCITLNKELDVIIESSMETLNSEISQVMSSKTANYFFNAVEGSVTGRHHLFESKKTKIDRAQFDAINGLVEKITGQTVKLATNGAETAGFFIKATEASGSTLHTAVYTIGKALGHSFKPWEAVKIAKNIGNVAKVLGPVASVISFFFDVKDTVDEANRSEELRKQRLKYRQMFIDIADDLEKQYIENLQGLFDQYADISRYIRQSREKSLSLVTKNEHFTEALASIKGDLTDIQKELFAIG